MKLKIQIACIVLLSVFMASCNRDNELVFQEAELINTIYRSLNCTTEQFTDSMAKQGMHVEAVSSTGIRYANSSRTDNDKLYFSINFKNDTITRVIFERKLNGKSNPADYYKLFSQAISDHGYTDWQGYYGDPAEHEVVTDVLHGSYSSAQEATNRSDLYSHLNNEHLKDVERGQYFAETFIYAHKDGSRWRGDLILAAICYFEHGLFEGSGSYVKQLYMDFMLRRIG